jgi:hypothetical protein
MEEVMILLAHAIADGFGVDTASALIDPSNIVSGTAVVMLELCKEKKIVWDSWYNLASCVYLGCPFTESVSEEHPAFGGMAFAAIQYGKMATQATWLDLTSRVEVRGCFGLLGNSGRIGVVTNGTGPDGFQFRSVEENFAIIETEITEDTGAFNSYKKKEAVSSNDIIDLQFDKSELQSDAILISVHEKFYRLLLRIRSKRHQRIVDPGDSLNAVIRSIPLSGYQQDSGAPVVVTNNVKVYDMEEILGRWPDCVTSDYGAAFKSASMNQETFHVSHILDTNLKMNVALALSVCNTAILRDPDSSALSDSLKIAKVAQRAPLREGEGGSTLNRYIINVTTSLYNKGDILTTQLLD